MYKLSANSTSIVRLYDGAIIPQDEGNTDYIEYQAWVAEGNVATADLPPTISPLDAAEVHIARYFTTARLLQMKVWWDQFPHEDTPKLSAVFDWTASITIKAAQGNTDFGNPPHSFEELLVEAMEQLGVTP